LKSGMIFSPHFFALSKVFFTFATNHWQEGFGESRWCDISVKKIITTLAVIWKI